MATSYALYPGDGIQTDWAVPFQYLDQAHVECLVDGVEVTFTWITASTVRVTPAVAIGDTLKVARLTPSAPLTSFSNTNNLTADNLNRAELQALYVAEEAKDRAEQSLVEDNNGNYDLNGRRIVDLGDPVDAQDAVTKTWAETSMTATLAQAITAKTAAETAQTAAEAAQTAAAGSQSAAATSATNAATSETNAEADRAAVAADKATVAADKATVAADKATVNTDKGIVAADKATVAADKATVNTDKGIVAADKATTQGYRDTTLTYLNTFRGSWLGSLASNPTLDGNGAAVGQGDFYWNSTAKEVRFYTGTAWGALPFNSGILNVIAYGADPTGVADSTSAINAAIAVANAGTGYTVYFPKGTYKITAALTTIDADAKVTVAGDGQHASTITTTHATANVLTFGNGGAAAMFYVRDIGITSSATRTAGAHIYCGTDASYGDIQNVRLNKVFYGIDVQWNGGVMKNLLINEGETTAFTNAQYIRIRNSSYGTIIDGVQTGTVNAGSEPFCGINLLDCDGALISNCNMMRCGNGLNIAPGTGDGVASIAVMNCWFDTCGGTGISINPTGTGFVVRLEFTNVAAAYSGFAGCFITRTGTSALIQGLKFTNCRFSMSQTDSGFAVYDCGTNVDVTVLNCTASGNANHGFFFNNVQHFAVIGCSSGAYEGQAANTGNGYYTLSCDKYILTNCRENGSSGGGYIETSFGGTRVSTNNI